MKQTSRSLALAALVSAVALAACRSKDEAHAAPAIELPAEARAATSDRLPEGGVSPPARRAETETSTGAHTVHRSHFTMGTQITITAFTADEPRALAAFDVAFREFDRLDQLLTVWRDASEVSRINQAAGRAPVEVSKDVMDVLARAKRGSEWSGGKFDVTFGVMSGLWKFDHDQDDKIPPADEIRRRISLIDYRDLVLDPAKSTAFLRRKGMRIHLGGIGKGFAVDAAVRLLRERGLRDFTVQAGGDLFVSGHHGDRAWRVGIRDPRGPPDKFFAAAEVTDSTFSTSGDYERFFFKDGRRYHHILDPATGSPATLTRSVTILAPDATTAEYASKAVFILGAEKGLPLIESLDGVGAVVVDASNRVHVSKRLEDKIKIFFPPTDAP